MRTDILNRRKLRNAIKYVIFTCLIVILFKYAYEHRFELANVISKMNVNWLGPVIVTLVAINLVTAGLWVFLLQNMGCRLSWGWLIAVWFRSLAGKYFPGSIWLIAGRMYQLRQAGVSLRIGAYASALEQLVTLAACAFVALLTPKLITLMQLPAWGGWLFAVPILVILFPNIIGEMIAKTGFRRFDLRMEHPPTTRFMLLYFLGHIGRTLLAGLAYCFLLFLFSIEPDKILLINLPGFAAAAFLAGYLSLLTPNGVGVKEGVFVLLLSHFVAPSAAILVAVSSRVFSILTDLVGILFASIYIYINYDNPSSITS